MDIYIPTIREALFNESHTTVKGYIKWEVINNDGSISQQGEHPNLILNAGLDSIATQTFADTFKYSCVGTGNSTPIETQIGLDNEVSRTGTYLISPVGSCGSTRTNNTLVMTRTFNWPSGAINTPITGPLAEVGFSWASTTGNNLWSRSLFKNNLGVPITITVDSDQQLRVSYTLTVTVGPLNWTDTAVNITGLGSVNYKIRSQASTIPNSIFALAGLNSVNSDGTAVSTTSNNFEPMNNSPIFNSFNSEACSKYVLTFVNATYPTAESLPSGALPTALVTNYATYTSTSYTVPFTSSSYVAGTFYKTRTIAADVNTANGNIQWIFSPTAAPSSNYNDTYRPMAYFFPTPIAKDNLHTLTLNFNHTWGRA